MGKEYGLAISSSAFCMTEIRREKSGYVHEWVNTFAMLHRRYSMFLMRQAFSALSPSQFYLGEAVACDLLLHQNTVDARTPVEGKELVQTVMGLVTMTQSADSLETQAWYPSAQIIEAILADSRMGAIPSWITEQTRGKDVLEQMSFNTGIAMTLYPFLQRYSLLTVNETERIY